MNEFSSIVEVYRDWAARQCPQKLVLLRAFVTDLLDWPTVF